MSITHHKLTSPYERGCPAPAAPTAGPYHIKPFGKAWSLKGPGVDSIFAHQLDAELTLEVVDEAYAAGLAQGDGRAA